MSKHRLVPILSAVGVFLIGAAAPQTCPAVLVTNFFNTDPQWTGVNNQNGFNNYGYTNTAVAGGAAGEVGGRFQRRAAESYYADTHFDAGYSLANALFGSGKFDATNNAAQDNSADIGHLSQGSADKSFLGLSVNESFNPAQIRIKPLVVLSDGTELAGVASNVTQNADYWFSYTYDPNGGAFSAGQMALTVTNTSGFAGSWTVDLTAAQRATGATLDAWGMYDPSINNTASFGEVYLDDVIYSVPEPTTLALLGLGGAMLMWRRSVKRGA